jgi:hypothetical protein
VPWDESDIEALREHWRELRPQIAHDREERRERLQAVKGWPKRQAIPGKAINVGDLRAELAKLRSKMSLQGSTGLDPPGGKPVTRADRGAPER